MHNLVITPVRVLFKTAVNLKAACLTIFVSAALPVIAEAASFSVSVQGNGCEAGDSGSDSAAADCSVAFASSGPGSLHVFALSVAKRDEMGVLTESTGAARATASFSDTISFSIDEGTFTIPLDLAGGHGSGSGGSGGGGGGTGIGIDVSEQGAPFATFGSISGGAGGQPFGARLEIYNQAGEIIVTETGTQAEVKEAVLPISNGVVRLSGGLRADASCGTIGTGGSCTVTVDYAASLRILGGTVRDSTGAVRTDVTVTSESGFDYLAGLPPHSFNTAPVADAGENQALSKLSVVWLDGTESMDPDDDEISFAWTLEPPAGSLAALDDDTSPTPSFVADKYGDYLATLVVTDSHGLASEPDTVTVGFANLPPVADAGLDQVVVAGDFVTLDGRNSSDVNMDPLSFFWSFKTIPTGSAASFIDATVETPGFFADEPGDYIVELVVSDGLLNSAPSLVTVTAVALEDAILSSLIDLMDGVSWIYPDDFWNRNMQKALSNKLNAIAKMIERENYYGALEKLQHDLLPKTDGCAAGNEPDMDDWIVSCQEQEVLSNQIEESIGLLIRKIES